MAQEVVLRIWIEDQKIIRDSHIDVRSSPRIVGQMLGAMIRFAQETTAQVRDTIADEGEAMVEQFDDGVVLGLRTEPIGQEQRTSMLKRVQ